MTTPKTKPERVVEAVPKSEENIDIMLPRQSSESCFKSTGTYIKVSPVNPKDNKRNSDRDKKNSKIYRNI